MTNDELQAAGLEIVWDGTPRAQVREPWRMTPEPIEEHAQSEGFRWQDRVLAVLKASYPQALTHAEICVRAGLEADELAMSRVCSARHQLERAGLVRRTGLVRGEHGQMVVVAVYVPPDEGRA